MLFAAKIPELCVTGRLRHGKTLVRSKSTLVEPLGSIFLDRFGRAPPGVARIVNSFLAAKEPAAVLLPSFSAPVMSLIDMAREGRGITSAPRRLIQRELQSGRQMRAGGEEWDIAISICLFRSRARLANAAESFWSAIKKPKGTNK